MECKKRIYKRKVQAEIETYIDLKNDINKDTI